MTSFVALDTAILSYLTKEGPLGVAYDALVGDRHVALSFQTVAELLAANLTPSKQIALDRAVARALVLPHQFETSRRYAEVARTRSRLLPTRRPGRDAGDADMWIIASAIEHRLTLIAHDKQMLALAREAGCVVETLLPGERRHKTT